MELVTSMRRVREIMTRPKNLHVLTDIDNKEDYIPNPTWFYFSVGNGLVIYKPKGVCLELMTALEPSDIPKNPIKELHKQWLKMASLGYHTIYSIVHDKRLKVALMCRSAGMEKTINKESFSIYTKVIHG